jgi:hypothetical protein
MPEAKKTSPRLDRRCRDRDADIHRLFRLGVSFPEMLDRLGIPGITTQTLQRYVSENRKADPERWPYRRAPKQGGANLD